MYLLPTQQTDLSLNEAVNFTPQQTCLTLSEEVNEKPISQSYKNLLFDHLLSLSDEAAEVQQNLSEARSAQQGSKPRKKLWKLQNFNIKPNIGSLSQFMDISTQENASQNLFGSIYNNKKKRTDKIVEEKQLRECIASHNLQDQILTSANTTVQEKRLAGKVIASETFKSVFGRSLESFEASTGSFTAKKKLLRNSESDKINVDRLTDTLDREIQYLVSEKENHSLFGPQMDQSFKDSKFSFNKRNPNSKKGNRLVHITLDSETKQKAMSSFKVKYQDLRNIEIPEKCKAFQEFSEIGAEMYRWQKHQQREKNFVNNTRSSVVISARNSILLKEPILITQPLNLEKRLEESNSALSLRTKGRIKISKQTVFRLVDEEIVINNFEILDLQMGLYMLRKMKLETVQKIHIESVRIQQSILFMFLDMVCKFAPKELKQFTISSVAIDNSTKLIQKLRNVLDEIKIRKASLNCLDIGSKEFVQLCIGFASSVEIECIELRSNRIDYLGVKALESLLSLCPKLKSIDLRNNDICHSNNIQNPQICRLLKASHCQLIV